MEENKNKYINIDDFAKVEIKVGKVVSAEIVEGSDKLLHLEVDFGEEREVESEGGLTEKEKHIRNVYSGIRKYVSVDDIVGKQFPFVTNLEPRKIMGNFSEAMILAASDDDDFTLFAPTNNIKNGSTLR